MRKLISLAFLVLFSTPAAWGAYAYKGTITVPKSLVSGCTGNALSNFTVGVELSDASFKPSGSGGQILHSGNANSLGQTVPYDLIFTSDAGGTTLLSWEIEYWDQTNGVVYAWVLASSLGCNSGATSTVFYVFYGGTTATFQGGAQGAAWDAYTAGVWHFGTSLNLKDYTANNNSVTNQSTTAQASAQIDGGVTFASNHRIDGPATGSLNLTGRPVTVSAWIKPTAVSGNYQHIVAKYLWGSSNCQYGLLLNFAYPRLTVCDGSGNISTHTASTLTVSAGAWAHVAGVQDATNINLYVNGAPDSGNGADGKTMTSQTAPFTFGATPDPSWNFTGDMDEIRVSSTARSGDWIATEYNNGYAITSFAVVSGLGPVTGAATITMTPIIM